MQEKNKRGQLSKPEEKNRPVTPENKPERSYYYDDAHGYEEYDPKKDSEEKDEDDEFED